MKYRMALALAAAALVAQAQKAQPWDGATPSNIVPTFDKGSLAVYDGSDIQIYSPDGSPALRLVGGKERSLTNAAVDTDGTAVAGVSRISNAATVGGVAVFDHTGVLLREFGTGEYVPTQLCFGPDHSLWTIGWKDGNTADSAKDFFILRHYSLDGKELGAYLPRSSLPVTDAGETPEASRALGRWGLRISKDRVGAFLYYVGRKGHLWVETGFDGKETGRWAVEVDTPPGAFTWDGDLYAQAPGRQLVKLDKKTGTWNAQPTLSEGILLGATENDLVFWRRGESALRYVALKR